MRTDAVCADNSTDNQTAYYTLVVLPDTQKYSLNWPEMFVAQTQWIADNYEKENIVAVAHVGDVVQDSDNQTQWDNAKQALDILRDNDIPFIVTPGNHDVLTENWTASFNATCNDSKYLLFSVNETPCIIAAVNNYETYVVQSVNETQQTLAGYSDRKQIILVHGYIWKGGTVVSQYGNDGLYVWEHLIKPSRNIFMVACGHLEAEGWSSDITDNGTLVNNFLANYQEQPKENQGWLRLYRFSANMTSMRVETYSPYLDKWKLGFTVNLLENNAPEKTEYTEFVPPAPVNDDSGGGSGGGYTAETKLQGSIYGIQETGDPELYLVARYVDGYSGVYLWRKTSKTELKALLEQMVITLPVFADKYLIAHSALSDTVNRYIADSLNVEWQTLTGEQLQDLESLALTVQGNNAELVKWLERISGLNG